jgi:DNA primase
VPLFPQQFIDDLKHHADIAVVIGDYVSLKKSGATYKGLCPFHGEKTPSFHVNRDKGFFHCFGCGVGGDVFKFLELHDKVGFADAVKQLAQRFGLPLPELEQNDEQRAGAAERETLLKIHESAAAWFRQQLATPAAARARALVESRGLTQATSEQLGLGFAPPGRDQLKRALLDQGYSQTLLLRSGLLVQRDDGTVIDRFRNRLMIPICRDTNAVIAFGGRALEPDQQPKYLNSPETPIYSKSRTLYGLNLAKTAIRQGGFAVMVEGYFDFAQVFQSGVQGVVATCGTALTPQQAQYLGRFTKKVVLSFDPDAAGQGATVKSCEMLVEEGFEVNVATLPAGQDPDTFIQKQGGRAYSERLKGSQPYLEYLLEQGARRHDLNTDEGRVKFLGDMLTIAARIPDAAMRDRFADRLAFKAQVTDAVVRDEIRKAAVQRQTSITKRTLPGMASGPGAANLVNATKAEKGLIWLLVHDPGKALAALDDLEPTDLEGLAARSVLDLAKKLKENSKFSPALFLDHSLSEAPYITGIASESEAHVHDAAECVRELKRRRYAREVAAVQQEIDRLQQRGAPEAPGQLDELLKKKLELIKKNQALA